MSAFAEQIANILSFNKTTPEIFIQRELFEKSAKGGNIQKLKFNQEPLKKWFKLKLNQIYKEAQIEDISSKFKSQPLYCNV